jgi:hypothetical protein
MINTGSKILDIILAFFAITIVIVTILVAETFLAYGGVYVLYHEKYDMADGCPKNNNSKCYHKNRLLCYDANLMGCCLGGVFFTLVIVAFLGILMLLDIIVKDIYRSCNDNDLSEEQGAENSINGGAVELE